MLRDEELLVKPRRLKIRCAPTCGRMSRATIRSTRCFEARWKSSRATACPSPSRCQGRPTMRRLQPRCCPIRVPRARAHRQRRFRHRGLPRSGPRGRPSCSVVLRSTNSLLVTSVRRYLRSTAGNAQKNSKDRCTSSGCMGRTEIFRPSLRMTGFSVVSTLVGTVDDASAIESSFRLARRQPQRAITRPCPALIRVVSFQDVAQTRKCQESRLRIEKSPSKADTSTSTAVGSRDDPVFIKAWLAVVLWIVLIFTTIPFVRQLREALSPGGLQRPSVSG